MVVQLLFGLLVSDEPVLLVWAKKPGRGSLRPQTPSNPSLATDWRQEIHGDTDQPAPLTPILIQLPTLLGWANILQYFVNLRDPALQ